mgnify:CR=1 FL=1
MTLLLSEDDALRNLLKGIKVTDQKAGNTRDVGVWFGQPDQEIRNQSYPYMTIDMIDIAEDPTRAHRGLVQPGYLPAPENGPDGETPYDEDTNNWYIHYPIPVNIDYQVTTYARQPRHDREILAQLLYTRLPLRFGVLEPDDGTVRRLDVLDISKRDITEQGKRLFVNAFTIRVSSEIAQELYNQVYKVLQVSVSGATGPIVHGKPTFTPIDSFTIQTQ